jgi:hypothetical protein
MGTRRTHASPARGEERLLDLGQAADVDDDRAAALSSASDALEVPPRPRRDPAAQTRIV